MIIDREEEDAARPYLTAARLAPIEDDLLWTSRRLVYDRIIAELSVRAAREGAAGRYVMTFSVPLFVSHSHHC